MNSEGKENITILVADDDLANLNIVLSYIRESGFKVLIARNGESAIRQAEVAIPDLILLDINMPPGIDGFETCRRLKQNKDLKNIPIVFLTELSDDTDKEKGIEAGGSDYINKPFDKSELLTRIKTYLRLNFYRKALEQKHMELQEANEALLESQKKIEMTAKTDLLTQLPTRREIIESIRYEMIRFERSKNPFTIALCNIDNFKKINDVFGHDCGDMILSATAHLMRSSIRKQDCLGSRGGGEFLFAFPETNIKGGKIVCEKLREKIAGSLYDYEDKKISITMTFGLSMIDDPGRAVEDYIRDADKALHKGKKQGKNCVVITDDKA